MDYALRPEDDERVYSARFAGIFNPDFRFDFGFGVKPTRGIYIYITCWEHRVLLPNHCEERQHGSWIPGKHTFLYIFPSCLCLSGQGGRNVRIRALSSFDVSLWIMSDSKSSEQTMDFGLACREIKTSTTGVVEDTWDKEKKQKHSQLNIWFHPCLETITQKYVQANWWPAKFISDECNMQNTLSHFCLFCSFSNIQL